MKKIIRLGLYFGGLFIIAIGINLAILSNLGVSPVSAFTVPVSGVTGMSLGMVTVIAYTGFVAVQLALLGKNFKLKNLLQVPFSMVFGFFIDYTGSIMRSLITADSYAVKLTLTLLGIIVCAFGATLYIVMDIVPNPPEGLNLAFSTRLNQEFGKVKMLTDCIFVVIGIAVSLIFTGRVTAIREGTVIAALLTGRLIGFFTKHMKPRLLKITFNTDTITERHR